MTSARSVVLRRVAIHRFGDTAAVDMEPRCAGYDIIAP
jgi:hypothetical protein